MKFYSQGISAEAYDRFVINSSPLCLMHHFRQDQFNYIQFNCQRILVEADDKLALDSSPLCSMHQFQQSQFKWIQFLGILCWSWRQTCIRLTLTLFNASFPTKSIWLNSIKFSLNLCRNWRQTCTRLISIVFNPSPSTRSIESN